MKKKTLDAVLRSTWNSVSKMYNREASKFDSTMAMGFALLNIDARGTTSTALGPRLGMESTSLSRLLNNMEKKKLISRKQNPSDGRSVLIFLTEFGKYKRDDNFWIVRKTKEPLNGLVYDYAEFMKETNINKCKLFQNLVFFYRMFEL